MEEWKGKRMGGWKIGSAKPFKTIKILIGVIDLEVCGPSQPWTLKKASIVLRGAEGPDDLQIKIDAPMLRNAESLRYSNDNSTFSSGRAVS